MSGFGKITELDARIAYFNHSFKIVIFFSLSSAETFNGKEDLADNFTLSVCYTYRRRWPISQPMNSLLWF